MRKRAHKVLGVELGPNNLKRVTARGVTRVVIDQAQLSAAQKAKLDQGYSKDVIGA